jgi:hypothetical protein
MTWQSAIDRRRGALRGSSALLASGFSAEERAYLLWRRG